MAVRINRIVVYLKALLRILSVSAGVALFGCGGFESTDIKVIPSSVDVVLAVGDTPGTRTEYDVATRRFVWNDGDVLAVWAKASDGTFALDNQKFSLLASGAGRQPDGEPDKSSAYFTSTLSSQMPEGTYSYYMTYPLPESVSGTTATFAVPAVQDGLASGGVDVLVAEPAVGAALTPIEEAVPVNPDNVLNVRMKHLLHYLRFYIPEGCNSLEEPVTRIEFTMPQAVAGKVSVDVTDASTASLGEGVTGMKLGLRKPIDESADGMDVAVAGIFPPQTAYSADERMEVSIYSENKWASLEPMSLEGRTFEAGHITPVPLRPTEARQLYKLKFTLASNNLGEDPYNIKLSLPEGVNWPGSSSNVLAFDGTHAGLIKVGDTFVVETKDEAEFRALSSQSLTISYESESALVTETLALGDLSSASNVAYFLNCPYLFFEDFSGVEEFSSFDQYGKKLESIAGSKSPVSFLNGWSAARAGAQAGTAIRIACRRETLADYPARADSPSLSGLKNGVTVNLDVNFDYSMNRQGYATWGITIPESQTVHIGYITTSDALKSGDDKGSFPINFDVKETTGSYTNINHNYNYVLEGVKADVNAPLRLSWRTTPEHDVGTSNTTYWLYIDNIRVKIKK